MVNEVNERQTVPSYQGSVMEQGEEGGIIET